MIDKETKIEERIENEIIIGAYDNDEKFSRWYNYLFENLTFPFDAIYQISLEESKNVNVINITEYDFCYDEKTVMVEATNKNEIISIPLLQIKNPEADEKTLEAIEDLQYWLTMGNSFDDEEFI